MFAIIVLFGTGLGHPLCNASCLQPPQNILELSPWSHATGCQIFPQATVGAILHIPVGFT